MGDSMKEIAAWLGMLGVPTIFAMMVGCFRSLFRFMNQIKILQSAQKAQMRSQLFGQYYAMKDEINNVGTVTDINVSEWLNQYKAYHVLNGDNGVLDEKQKEVVAFPTRPAQ